MDQQKLKDDEAQYLHGALVYKGEFGDLLLWKQLLAEARDRPICSVVFVTDDVKEDWWWLADSEGTKKIGARPELVEEIMREARVKYFKMYTSERFLAYASEHEGACVSKESIQHVRDIARLHAVIRSRRLSQVAHAAILDWLHLVYPEDEIRVQHTAGTEDVPHYPDYIVVDSQDGTGMGFDVRAISHWTGFRDRHRKALEQAAAGIAHQEVQFCWIVYVTAREGIVDSFCEAIRKYRDLIPQDVGVKLALLRGGQPSTAASLDWKLSIPP